MKILWPNSHSITLFSPPFSVTFLSAFSVKLGFLPEKKHRDLGFLCVYPFRFASLSVTKSHKREAIPKGCCNRVWKRGQRRKLNVGGLQPEFRLQALMGPFLSAWDGGTWLLRPRATPLDVPVSV